MEEKNEVPLVSLFQKKSKGETKDSNIYPENINEFFKYLKNKVIPQDDKAETLNNLTKKIKVNRYICEFFSTYEDESIYIFLFKLFLEESTTDKLKESILNLINELRINIEANKIIYDFLFQKFAVLYKNKQNANPQIITSYLNLLNSLLGETENILKPRNYYACSGNCQFNLNLGKNLRLDIGYALTFILNFKIGHLPEDNQNSKNEKISNLIKIEFINGFNIDIDLKYPMSLIVKKINENIIKVFSNEEWISFVINLIFVDNIPTIYFFVNGENRLTPFKLPANSIKSDSRIKSISFFNNFYGEVTSIIMLSQKNNAKTNINSTEFLSFFKDYKEGFWNAKKFGKLIEKLKSIESTIKTEGFQKIPTFHSKTLNLPLKLLDSKIDLSCHLSDNLLFIFSPFSASYMQPGLIENCLSDINYKLNYSGNIKLHHYYCYQNKLSLIRVIKNIIPIAEIFLIHSCTLNENNLIIFLQIIENILKYRKYNINSFKEYKIFPILSLFIEKYPKKFFTENILNSFFIIGKAIFSTENICQTYFKYILLNEKIISKYSEELQIKFWGYILLFYESDRTQIEKFMNMNRICLILRYYDRNKYTEMCCQEHLDSIKEEFIGSKSVMNPPMNKKVQKIKDLMDNIISGTDPKNAISLFKLLTLDLSPCLIRFIINTFISVLQKESTGDEWKNEFVDELINSKFEVIMINTFIHTLLEIRIDILILIYEIHKRLSSMHRGNTKNLENMLKTCLIPQKMFYFSKKDIQNDYAEENKKILKPQNTIFSTNNEKISSMLKEKEKNDNMKKAKTNIGLNEILIFKDEFYEKYKEKLINIFLLWSFGKRIDEKINSLDIKENIIKNANILEILFACEEQSNDPDFTLKFINSLESIVEKGQNAYILLLNKKIISLILDMSFRMFKSDEKKIKNLFNKSRSLITNIFNNTISFLEKSKVFYPFDEIDTGIFLWGDKLLITEFNNKLIKDNLYDFLDDLLLEILTAFKVKYEPQMKFTLTNPDFDPVKNFYLKNYLILINHLFRFSFQYKYDSTILSEGISFIPPSQKITSVLELYISSMRIVSTKGDSIIKQWSEFPFFDEIFKRIHGIWSKNNSFKNIMSNSKTNKLLKYEEILQKMILDKDYKNLFIKELNILTYEQTIDSREYIIPLIKIISISLMCVLSNSINNTDFKHWLKEFKYFVRFLIISSTNLTRKDQLDYYLSIQDKCVNTLIACLSFWKDLTLANSIYKEKIEKGYKRILLFCFLIVKFQYQYTEGHKVKLKLFKNFSRNNLIQSAVCTIFFEKVKNQLGNPLLTFEKVDKTSLNDYNKLFEEMDNKEWKIALYENSEIKEELDTHFFCLKGYKTLVDKRYKLFQMIKDEQIDNYKEDILLLLPLYENELAKYSNNSLENSKKIKNYYKKYKKESFCWGGYWSDRNLFYNNIDKLKVKIINHYTKNFMKPVLAPILDMSYYLPEFSGFNPDTLFNKNDSNYDNAFKLTLDMEKILKLNVTQSNISKNENQENFLRRIYIKSNPDLAKNLLKISNNLDFGKEEEFSIIQKSKNSKNDNNEKKNYFLGCLVKSSHHIKGVFFIEENELNFRVFLNQKTGNAMSDVEVAFTSSDDDYDQERQTCFGSYFVCHPKDKDLYKITINYDNIKYLLRRRYYYKNSAMEIYTSSNKTFYFNFKYEEDRETVVNEIVNKLKEYARILDDLKEPKDIYDNVVGYQNTLVLKARKKNGKKKYKIKLSKKILAWKEWRMSTYELLMWLNIYSNRSYNDISQYPVFPWILSDYSDPIKDKSNNYDYRDLSLPMGMMELNEEGEKRKELFMETFDVLKNESDGSMKPYIYGSNYSNPMYVCNFMMRLFPFTHISIELQGNKFDDANRLFLSVKNSFNNSITQKTDVRELIPEFYYMPEMFININGLNMGVEENGKKVNDVLTPCQNNPYEFVITLKTVLEKEIVSYSISNWIDLIFGYKAKGKEAELAFNLFTEASYQEDINMNTTEDKESFLRRVEFGLIPNQIITKECPKREKKEEIYKDKQIIDSSLKKTVTVPKIDNEQDSNEIINNDSLLLKVKSIGDKLILFFNDNLLIEEKISFSIFDRDYKKEITYKLDLGKVMNKMSDFYFNIQNNNKVIEFCDHGKMLILGGFYDGKIRIKYLDLDLNTKEDNYIEISPFNEDSATLSLAVDSDEEYLFVGNSRGNVALYKMNIEEKKIDKLLIISDQISPIIHIHCNSVLNLWVSMSIDGIINLYTLPLSKLIRSLKIDSKKCAYSFLISSPLPCIVAICDEEKNNKIFVYSINGKLLKKKENLEIKNPIILKDAYFNEYLAYLNNDSVCILSLPYLETAFQIDGIQNSHIFCSNEDMSLLYVLNKNGSEVKLIRDEDKKNIRPSSFIMRNFVNKH